MSPATEAIPSRHLDDAVREIDLPSVAVRTWRQLETATTDYSAHTLLKQPGLRVVLITLAKGARIPEHRASGAITVQVLAGKIHFRVGAEALTMGRGRLVGVAGGLLHDLFAEDDSEVLLTIQQP